MLSFNESVALAKTQGGANFWYGLSLRPSGMSCQPDGFTAVINKETALDNLDGVKHANHIRHGAIAYALELEESQMTRFDLIDLNLPEFHQDIASFESEFINALFDVYESTDLEAVDKANAILEDWDFATKNTFKNMTVFSDRKNHPEIYTVIKARYDEIVDLDDDDVLMFLMAHESLADIRPQ